MRARITRSRKVISKIARESGLPHLKRLGLRQVAYPAVLCAVSEINNESNDEPDDQSRPVDPSELVHHVAVKEHTEKWNNRQPSSHENSRCAKRAGLFGTFAAQHRYAHADDPERQPRPHAHLHPD